MIEIRPAPEVLALDAAVYEGLSQEEVVEVERIALRGARGRTLLQFVGAIEKGDVKIMARAIEEGCEKVDADGW